MGGAQHRMVVLMVNTCRNTHIAVEYLGKATAGPVCDTMEPQASMIHFNSAGCAGIVGMDALSLACPGILVYTFLPTFILNKTLPKLDMEEQYIMILITPCW